MMVDEIPVEGTYHISILLQSSELDAGKFDGE